MALDIPRVEYKNIKKKSTPSREEILSHVSSDYETANLNRMASEQNQKEWQKMKLSDLETQTNTEHNG